MEDIRLTEENFEQLMKELEFEISKQKEKMKIGSIVELIENPLVDTTIDGLTIGEQYIVIETFYSNPADKYIRVIDDNGKCQAWNSTYFKFIK